MVIIIIITLYTVTGSRNAKLKLWRWSSLNFSHFSVCCSLYSPEEEEETSVE